MFDLSKNIVLDSQSLRTYRNWQAFLYLLAMAIGLYITYLMLFPSSAFVYNFSSDSTQKNTIDSPRNDQMAPLDHGVILEGESLYFNSSLIGDYSKLDVSFELSKKSAEFTGGELEIEKSYQAFLNPESNPMGFKNGSLIRNGNDYYLVTDEKLRMFTGISDLLAMGFSQNAFKEVTVEEIKYNPPGENISSSLYPDATIFRVADDYYFMAGGKLKKFVSLAAFDTQYDRSQAVQKDENFLNSNEIEEDMIGFSDGTLISYAEGVYVVSGENVYPFDLPSTFLAKGYDFKNVIPASADEFSLYKKARIFTIRGAHPDGTIFHVANPDQWFYASSGKKHLLPSPAIASSWLKSGNAVEVSKDWASSDFKCSPSKDKYSLRSYSCEADISGIDTLGSSYQFRFKPSSEIKLDSIDLMFRKDLDWKNLRSSLGFLYNRIKGNYVR